MAAGAAMTLYTLQTYDLGSLRSMGPGMFPAAIGTILAVLGLLIAIPALFRPGTLPAIEFRSPLFVSAGIAAFALTIRTCGLLPAIIVVTVISSFAGGKFRPVTLVALSAGLCLAAWLVFIVGLGLTVPIARWPF